MTKERLKELMQTEGSPLAVCVGSWHAYNACNEKAFGSPFIDLAECDGADELREALEMLGFDAEDFAGLFVQDASGCVGALLSDCDHTDPLELADAAKEIDAATKRESGEAFRDCGEEVAELMDATGLNVFEIAKHLDEYAYTGEDNLADAAAAVVENSGMLYEVPESLRLYVDYEALGRDMEIDGSLIQAREGGKVFQCLA